MHSRKIRQMARTGLFMVFIVGISLFVFTHWGTLIESLQLVRTLPISLFAMGVVMLSFTFVAAAFSYKSLAFKKLPFRELLLIELAAAFVSRIVPSGLGSLGLHGWYLHKRKHTAAQATTVVSVNNALGTFVHISLITITVVCVPSVIPRLQLGWSFHQWWLAFGLLLFMTLTWSAVRSKIIRFMRNMMISIRRYEKQPIRLMQSAFAMLVLTSLNVILLTLVVRALHIDLNILEVFIVYSSGIFLGTLVPTPGGLAGVEAGIVTGLVAYNVETTIALSIALAFRFVTYWLPLIPGAVAVYFIKHKHLI